MANFVTNKFKELVAKAQLNLTSDTIRVLLERSTSTYVPNKDHNFLSDLSGLVEVSVTSYSRKSLANKAVSKDDVNDRAEFDADDVSFGALETGQVVKAVIVYQQVGGDDTTPGNDPFLAYIDTATGLPLTLNGGAVTMVIDTEGLIQIG